MIEIKKQCVNCKGKRYKKNINKLTGQTACFLCNGRGYFVQMVDEDEAAAIELKQMGKQQLALADHDKYHWQCSVEGCLRYTAIRDYGIAPWYHTRWGWLDLSATTMLCYQHNKEVDRGGAPFYKLGAGDKHLIAIENGKEL